MSTQNPNTPRKPEGARPAVQPPKVAPRRPAPAPVIEPIPVAPNPPPRAPRKSGGYMGTAIMVGVFALLAGALFLLTNNPQAGVLNPTATAPPPPVVWDLSAGTASSMRVDTISGTVALQIVAGQWQITAPMQEAASQFQVGAAVDQLKKITAQQVITAPTDLAQYGLTTPAMTVTLVISGITPPENRLLVGGTSVDGGSYYVKTADKPAVYVVLNTLIEQLKSWVTTPPKAEPTPTALVINTPAPIVSGTLTSPLTTTPNTTPVGPVAPPGTPATTPAGSSTPPTVGTQMTPAAGTTMTPAAGAITPTTGAAVSPTAPPPTTATGVTPTP